MKKNLRIVSAAAAALLAVAPVAATAVSTVSADATSTTSSVTATGYNVPGTITLDRGSNTQFSVKLNDTQKEAIIAGVSALNGAKPSDLTNFRVTTATGQNSEGVFQQTIAFDYKEKSYSVTANAKFASQQGTPYFYNTKTNTVVDNGSTVSLDNIANGFSSADLLSEIRASYAWKTSDASGSNAEMTTTASDVESQLVAQGLKRASNGDFDYPANGFNLKLTAKSENGNTASITVRINASVNYNAPAFVFGGNVYFDNNNTVNGKASSNLVLKDTTTIDGKTVNLFDNGKLNESAVLGQVSVYAQSAYKNTFDKTPAELAAHQQLINSSNIKIDSSKVNSSVAGLYPVVISATNPAGFTSKLTVYVIVMGPTEKAPQEYVKADNTKVYEINGNVVSDAKVDALSKGAAVYTFGKVTVDGVEYTRINSNDSNKFVKSSDLQATAPEAENVTSESKTIMHAAYYYNKDGKRVGTDKIGAYNTVNVLPNKVTINGKSYFQVVENGKAVDKYINAGNIEGTKRTLKHNAYVYKNNGKAKTHKVGKKTKKVLVKKGTVVTTYGAKFTNINGKTAYYRIGRNNEYVKVANF